MYRRDARRRPYKLIAALIVVSAVAVLQETGLGFLQDLGKAQTPSSTSPKVLRGGSAWNGGSSKIPSISKQEQTFSRGAKLTGSVTHVRDGDTIEVEGVPVRIANLDCAERGTSAGTKATRRMRELSALGHMSCTLEGRKSYDREVGVCAMSDGRDVGEVLIAEAVCDRWRW